MGNKNNNDLTIVPATDSERELLEANLEKEEKQRLEAEEKKLREEQEKQDAAYARSLAESRDSQPCTPDRNSTGNKHPNMRTGRSGHCALLSAKVHKKTTDEPYHIDTLHKRSNTRGLTIPKANVQKVNSFDHH